MTKTHPPDDQELADNVVEELTDADLGNAQEFVERLYIPFGLGGAERLYIPPNLI